MKKGRKIAHVEASNIVPMMAGKEIPNNVLKKEAGNALKSTLLKNVINTKKKGLTRFWKV